jgi:hypothetical protein
MGATPGYSGNARLAACRPLYTKLCNQKGSPWEENMRRTLSILAVLIFCFSGYAMAAGSEENAENFKQVHDIEISWHTAQTTKNLDLMLSLFANDAVLTARGKSHTGMAQIKQFWQASAVFQATEPVRCLHATIAL